MATSVSHKAAKRTMTLVLSCSTDWQITKLEGILLRGTVVT